MWGTDVVCLVILGCRQPDLENVSGNFNFWIHGAGTAAAQPDVLGLALIATRIAADINVDAKQLAFIGTMKGSRTRTIHAFTGHKNPCSK